MRNDDILARINRRIFEAEERFEAEKRSLFTSTTDQDAIELGRIHLKDLERQLASMHEMRVCLTQAERARTE